jgi:hypothetical protein
MEENHIMVCLHFIRDLYHAIVTSMNLPTWSLSFCVLFFGDTNSTCTIMLQGWDYFEFIISNSKFYPWKEAQRYPKMLIEKEKCL